MSEFFHECQSQVGQGRLCVLPLDPQKTPYQGEVDEFGVPTVLAKPETPQYFENYYCKHCGTHMMRLVPLEVPGE